MIIWIDMYVAGVFLTFYIHPKHLTQLIIKYYGKTVWLWNQKQDEWLAKKISGRRLQYTYTQMQNIESSKKMMVNWL